MRICQRQLGSINEKSDGKSDGQERCACVRACGPSGADINNWTAFSGVLPPGDPIRLGLSLGRRIRTPSRFRPPLVSLKPVSLLRCQLANGVANRASWLFQWPVASEAQAWWLRHIPVVGGSLARLLYLLPSTYEFSCASPVASLPVQVPYRKCLRA